MEEESEIIIRAAVPADVKYVYAILYEMECSARERGTGIARPYIQPWQNGAFVSNGGLIVRPEYRGMHIGRYWP